MNKKSFKDGHNNFSKSLYFLLNGTIQEGFFLWLASGDYSQIYLKGSKYAGTEVKISQ